MKKRGEMNKGCRLFNWIIFPFLILGFPLYLLMRRFGLLSFIGNKEYAIIRPSDVFVSWFYCGVVSLLLVFCGVLSFAMLGSYWLLCLVPIIIIILMLVRFAILKTLKFLVRK